MADAKIVNMSKMMMQNFQKKVEETQEENCHLRSYIDKVLANIMENCSHLLDVTNK